VPKLGLLLYIDFIMPRAIIIKLIFLTFLRIQASLTCRANLYRNKHEINKNSTNFKYKTVPLFK